VRLAGFDHDDPAIAAHVLDELVEMVTSGWGRPDSDFARLATPADGRERDRAQVARVQRQALGPRDLDNLARTWLSLDARELCSRIEVPVLVVVRTGDLIVSPEQGRWAAKNIPNATLVELPGDDHYFFLGNRRELVAAIEEWVHGEPVPTVADGRLAAAVLVDIVGSTARAQEEGRVAWQGLLERHEAAIRDAVDRHDGRVVNTAGDSFLVLFDSAACAVRFGLLAQRRSTELDLAVRIGVHVGEVDERSDAAVGVALHVVARVQALAQPGEVLVTGTVRDALLGSDIAFVPRGRRALRGLPGRWSLFGIGTA
jgi:class 3 adenylate cyclase